jgi:thioredoxin reductase
MRSLYDLIIIGSGPAGLAAAVTARKYNLAVLVIDEQGQPGGQIYRCIEDSHPAIHNILGNDYVYGRNLARNYRNCGAEHLSGAVIWQVDQDLGVCYSLNGKSRQIRAKRILIATGAMERPVPIPGWTLPGVMGAGAADILLKSANMVPAGRTVLAGSGPLLLLVACHLLTLRVSVAAILETTPLTNYITSISQLPKALKAFEYLRRGLAMRWQILRSSVPVYQNVSNLTAMGSNRIEAVGFTSHGRHRKINVDTLLLHDGVVPNTQITRQLQCEHDWYDVQRYWKPVLDEWGSTTSAGVGVAGDSGGIFGARAAEISGHLAALEATCRLNVISRRERDRAATALRPLLNRERSIRPFLDHLFRPNPKILVPRDGKTIVCRCEEITVEQIRESAALGALGPNQVKSQTRCGMGPCQGRLCGLTVSEIIARERKVTVPEVGYYGIRPPIKPIPLGELAELELAQ